jgi:hypothetical protein
MSDAGSIVKNNGGLVLWATDISFYGSTGIGFQGQPQICQFAMLSSAQSAITTALGNAGFKVKQAAGSPEYFHASGGISAGGLGPSATVSIGTNTPLLYAQAST